MTEEKQCGYVEEIPTWTIEIHPDILEKINKIDDLEKKLNNLIERVNGIPVGMMSTMRLQGK